MLLSLFVESTKIQVEARSPDSGALALSAFAVSPFCFPEIKSGAAILRQRETIDMIRRVYLFACLASAGDAQRKTITELVYGPYFYPQPKRRILFRNQLTHSCFLLVHGFVANRMRTSQSVLDPDTKTMRDCKHQVNRYQRHSKEKSCAGHTSKSTLRACLRAFSRTTSRVKPWSPKHSLLTIRWNGRMVSALVQHSSVFGAEFLATLSNSTAQRECIHSADARDYDSLQLSVSSHCK